MSDPCITALTALIDHLAARGVSWLSVQDGETLIEIELRPETSVVATTASPHKEVVLSRGPGIFRTIHPAGGASVPCLAAGDFLFPVSSELKAEDELLAQEETVVGYGTPLLRRAPQTEGQ